MFFFYIFFGGIHVKRYEDRRHVRSVSPNGDRASQWERMSGSLTKNSPQRFRKESRHEEVLSYRRSRSRSPGQHQGRRDRGIGRQACDYYGDQRSAYRVDCGESHIITLFIVIVTSSLYAMP